MNMWMWSEVIVDQSKVRLKAAAIAKTATLEMRHFSDETETFDAPETVTAE